MSLAGGELFVSCCLCTVTCWWWAFCKLPSLYSIVTWWWRRNAGQEECKAKRYGTELSLKKCYLAPNHSSLISRTPFSFFDLVFDFRFHFIVFSKAKTLSTFFVIDAKLYGVFSLLKWNASFGHLMDRDGYTKFCIFTPKLKMLMFYFFFMPTKQVNLKKSLLYFLQ